MPIALHYVYGLIWCVAGSVSLKQLLLWLVLFTINTRNDCGVSKQTIIQQQKTSTHTHQQNPLAETEGHHRHVQKPADNRTNIAVS